MKSVLPLHAFGILALAACTTVAHAQISLQSAVNLALKNSPKVRGAQADLAKARAARGEAKDAYVPMIATTGGYGQATGAPLDVPKIFSISAKSLLFSYSQPDYIRSAEQAVEASQHALKMVETEVTEDTTNTYLALDYGLRRRAVLRQELELADQLVSVTADRITAGVDPKVEAPKSHRTATQIRLSALQIADEMAANAQHLSTLTGLPAASIATDHSSIPEFTRPAPVAGNIDEIADSEGIKAAFATAKSKQYAAFGDHRYLLRPQVALGGNYSRVDTGLSSYAAYYPKFGADGNSQNALGFGLEITIPLLDLAHRSKARESAADATRAFADAEQQRGVYREGRAKLQNSAVELDLRSQLARDEQEIAQDQLDAIKVQLQANAANTSQTLATPKDQLNAQLQERQKYLDVLNAELQLRQTQVNLLRQTEGLGDWILRSPGTRSLTPSLPSSGTFAAPGNVQSAPPGSAPTDVAPSPAPIQP